MKIYKIILFSVLSFLCFSQVASADTYITQNITGNTTWNISNSPYIISNDIDISSGATLNIGSGVVVRFVQGKTLNVYGNINISGTSYQKNAFTSASDPLDDSASCNAWNAPNQGRWYIKIRGGSIAASNTNFRCGEMISMYGGEFIVSNSKFYGMDTAIYMSSLSQGIPNVNVNSSEFSTNRGIGISCSYGNLNVNNSNFNNNNYGMGVSNPCKASLTGNYFISNINPMFYGIDYVNSTKTDSPIVSFSDNTLVSNNYNGLQLRPYKGLIKNLGIPYVLDNGDMNDVVVEGGTVIKLNRGFEVTNSFETKGEPSNPIILTSINDDAALGDTNVNGIETPISGSWRGIWAKPSSNIKLLNTEIKYAGQIGYFHDEYEYNSSDSAGSILVDGAIVTLNNVKIQNSLSAGITVKTGGYCIRYDYGSDPMNPSRACVEYRQGTGSLNADGVVFDNLSQNGSNEIYGVINQNPGTSTALILNSWWGDANGPKPVGNGYSITTGVTYDPWMRNYYLPDARTIKVAVVLSEPYDLRHISTPINARPCKLIEEKTYQHGYDKEYYKDLLFCVSDYWRENSYGKIKLEFTIYDNNGQWYKLTEPWQTELYYVDNPKYFVVHTLLGPAKNIITDSDITIVVHSGKARTEFNKTRISSQTWIPKYQPLGLGLYKIIVGSDNGVGIFAHEIGHIIGALTTLGNTVMPDLYRMGSVREWDLMALGAISDDPNKISLISSITREFYGWLSFDIHPLSGYGAYVVTPLTSSKLNDKTFRYNLTDSVDESEGRYYVAELRNKNNSIWDSSIGRDDDTVILYYIDDNGQKQKYGYINSGDRIAFQDRRITILGHGVFGDIDNNLYGNSGILSVDKNEKFIDYDNLLVFNAYKYNNETKLNIEKLDNDNVLKNYNGYILRSGFSLSTIFQSQNAPYNGMYFNDDKIFAIKQSKISILSSIFLLLIYLITTKVYKKNKIIFWGIQFLFIPILLIKWNPLVWFTIIYLIAFGVFTVFVLLRKLYLRLRKKDAPSLKNIHLLIPLLCIIFSIIYLFYSYRPSLEERYGEGSLYAGDESLIVVASDLHAITPSGFHIGLNYVTGQFENQIEGSIVSGPNNGAPEWIYVPKDIDVKYYISTKRIDDYLTQNPEIAQNIATTSIQFEAYARTVNETEGIITTPVINESIEIGDTKEYKIEEVNNTIILKEAKQVITITPDNKEVYLHDYIPELTYSLNEPLLDITGAPACTTNATNISNIGKYDITCTKGTLSSNSYSFLFATGTLNISYKWSGLLSPIIENGVYKQGRTLPVKFKLFDIFNIEQKSDQDILWNAPVKGNILTETTPIDVNTEAINTNETFRYDEQEKQYIYNWDTKIYQSGFWYKLPIVIPGGYNFQELIGIK